MMEDAENVTMEEAVLQERLIDTHDAPEVDDQRMTKRTRVAKTEIETIADAVASLAIATKHDIDPPENTRSTKRLRGRAPVTEAIEVTSILRKRTLGDDEDDDRNVRNRSSRVYVYRSTNRIYDDEFGDEEEAEHDPFREVEAVLKEEDDGYVQPKKRYSARQVRIMLHEALRAQHARLHEEFSIALSGELTRMFDTFSSMSQELIHRHQDERPASYMS